MKSKAILLVVLSMVMGLLLSSDAWAGRRIKKAPKPRKKVVVVKPRHIVKPVKVVKLPAAHKKIIVKDAPFYFNAGVWYKPGPQGYAVVRAPLGARIKVLPVRHTTVVFRGVTFYHYYGAYYLYDQDAEEYYVVETPGNPQNGDIVTLIDGEVLEGRYLGGDEETIEFQVDDEVYEIDVVDIVSLQFEPPTE